jgi:hypothetical protein
MGIANLISLNSIRSIPGDGVHTLILRAALARGNEQDGYSAHDFAGIQFTISSDSKSNYKIPSVCQAECQIPGGHKKSSVAGKNKQGNLCKVPGAALGHLIHAQCCLH